ncbi:hypothetical protein BGZ65_004322 [Modicella reniformis]|uniref:Uncharacterized protein n=1 Tax=Modicella reniformis TaxID=1440133 RepID=A0A9P6MKV0_9FUNG|nr:hypothetical protein BGZ65_004322 [Modicella reniformis]
MKFMPEIIATTDAILFPINYPFDHKHHPVIERHQVHDLRHVPDVKSLKKIFRDLNCHEGTSLVNIPEIGTFPLDALRMLLQVQETRAFTQTLLTALEFISMSIRKEDPTFSQWLLQELCDKTGLYLRLFLPLFYVESEIYVKSILSICTKECLSVTEECLDEGAIDGIMAFFRRCYGQEGRTIFLSPMYKRNDDEMNTVKEHIRRGRAKTLFVFVYMDNHFGVVRLGLDNYEMSFGGSRGGPVPVDEIDTLIGRIQPSGDAEAKWEQAKKNISNFDVARQQDSGSCGILAAIAIEREMNKYVNWNWGTNISIKDHRIRFLRLLTGYTKAEEDEFVVVYRKHVPDEGHYPTETEHMDQYFRSIYQDWNVKDGNLVENVGAEVIFEEEEWEKEEEDEEENEEEEQEVIVMVDDDENEVERIEEEDEEYEEENEDEEEEDEEELEHLSGMANNSENNCFLLEIIALTDMH